MDRFVTRFEEAILEAPSPDPAFGPWPRKPPRGELVWRHASGGQTHWHGPTCTSRYQLYRWRRTPPTKKDKWGSLVPAPLWNEDAWERRSPTPCIDCGHEVLWRDTVCYVDFLLTLDPTPYVRYLFNGARVFSSPDQVIEHLPPSHGTHH